jgi:hypothetical protein
MRDHKKTKSKQTKKTEKHTSNIYNTNNKFYISFLTSHHLVWIVCKAIFSWHDWISVTRRIVGGESSKFEDYFSRDLDEWKEKKKVDNIVWASHVCSEINAETKCLHMTCRTEQLSKYRRSQKKHSDDKTEENIVSQSKKKKKNSWDIQR